MWWVSGVLFLPGLLALGLLPEAQRFIGLLVWMAVWLALLFILLRRMGDVVRVTLDAKGREIVWRRNGQTTRSTPFAEVKGFELAQLSIASRPYRTFQLLATLKNGSRITLAVDPHEAEIRKALKLAQTYWSYTSNLKI